MLRLSFLSIKLTLEIAGCKVVSKPYLSSHGCSYHVKLHCQNIQNDIRRMTYDTYIYVAVPGRNQTLLSCVILTTLLHLKHIDIMRRNERKVKRPVVAASQTQDTPGLSCQCSVAFLHVSTTNSKTCLCLLYIHIICLKHLIALLCLIHVAMIPCMYRHIECVTKVL